MGCVVLWTPGQGKERRARDFMAIKDKLSRGKENQ